MSEEQEKVVFKCEDCQTIHSSEVDLKLHLDGNKHRKKVANSESKVLNGVYVGNLPQHTSAVELLSFIGTFGKIKKSFVGERFAKITFEKEEDALSFRNAQHVYKNRTLRTRIWIADARRGNDEKDAQDKEIEQLVATSLATNSSVDEQVDTLLNVVLMPQNQVSSYLELCRDLEACLNSVYGSEFSMHLFGSVITGLAFKMSDLDVVVDTKFTLQHYQEENVSQETIRLDKTALNRVSNAIKKRFRNVVPIASAKIPIVRCIHRATNISCDVSFSNVTGVQNSYLIQRYTQSDSRVRALLVIIKYWAKYFDLKKTCFSNYALVMMGVFYLMQHDDSPLPPVIDLQRTAQRRIAVDGWNCSFDFEYSFKPLDSTITVLDLLQGFFDFYAQFDYGMYVVSPLIGKAIPKIFFKDVQQLPQELFSTQANQTEALEQVASLKIDSNICVQDPFILDRNITSLVKGDFAVKLQRMFMCSANVLKEDCIKKGTTGFLKHLLQKRTEDLLFFPSYWRKPISDNVEIYINVDSFIPTLECYRNISVDDVRNIWFDEVFSLIKGDVLERSFLFEVDEIEPSKKSKNIVDLTDSTDEDDLMSPSKKMKGDTTEGDHVENSRKFKRIVCKREGPDLFCHRKLIKKEMALNENMSLTEMNEAVSKHMMKLQGPTETVTFTCCFHLMSQPTHIILEMSNLGGSETAFKSWVTYATAHLQNWLAQLMPTTRKANSSEVSVTTEPSDSGTVLQHSPVHRENNI